MEQAHRVKVQGQAEVRVLAIHPAGALDKAQAQARAGARVRAQAGVLDKVKAEVRAEALEKAAEAGNKLYLK
jgi:hypothetical protein